MTDVDKVLAYLRALITRDFAKAAVANAEMHGVPAETVALVAAATFLNAVLTRFEPGVDVREITRFVQAAHDRFEDNENLDPLLSEAAIRAALGEPHLLKNADASQVFHTQVTLAYALLNGRSTEELDRFFVEAKDLLSE